MSTFVLIHGSWGGGWCWDKLAPLLRAKGHTAVAPDLPGHGEDRTPVAEITLDSYVNRVSAVLDAQREPVVLVGHSHGGVVITQTAEKRPDRVAALVYVCAFLPRDGESVLALAEQDPDPERNILRFLELHRDEGWAVVRKEGIREALVHDCTAADVAWIEQKIVGVREPLSSPATPVRITAERFGKIPRFYVEALDDRAISAALQKKMYTANPCREVRSMDVAHFPQITKPAELADHLVAIAASVSGTKAGM
ncbi:MAG: alpha/beta fold hydrolase [Candidatus Binatia bacterium]